jgi:hypothetical protein
MPKSNHHGFAVRDETHLHAAGLNRKCLEATAVGKPQAILQSHYIITG